MIKDELKFLPLVVVGLSFLGLTYKFMSHDAPLVSEISFLEKQVKNSEILRDSTKESFLKWQSKYFLPADTNLYQEKIDSVKGELKKLNEKGYQNLSTKETNKKYDLQIGLGRFSSENDSLKILYKRKLKNDKDLKYFKGQIDSLKNKKWMF